jgi:hypothetical protein
MKTLITALTGFVVSAILLASVSTASAQTYWVDPAEGEGMSRSDLAAVTELVKGTAGAEATLAGSRAKAEFVLVPSLLKLGDSLILSLQKKNAAGQVVFVDRLKAQSMSEMDTVAERLTVAVLQRKKVAQTQDVTNVTATEETKSMRRVQATRQWMLGLGPGWASNLKSQGGGFTFLLGYLWGLDPDFAINLSWTMNQGPGDDDDSSYNDFSIGGEYYLSRQRFSPFAGARFGWGTARASEDKCNALSIGCDQDRASGWSGTLNLGIKGFRTSTVNAALVASYSTVFDENKQGQPSLTALQFVVYY